MAYKVLSLVEGEYLLSYSKNYNHLVDKIYYNKESAKQDIENLIYWYNNESSLKLLLDYFEIVEIDG